MWAENKLSLYYYSVVLGQDIVEGFGHSDSDAVVIMVQQTHGDHERRSMTVAVKYMCGEMQALAQSQSACPFRHGPSLLTDRTEGAQTLSLYHFRHWVDRTTGRVNIERL